jgi:hypothetical protein
MLNKCKIIYRVYDTSQYFIQIICSTANPQYTSQIYYWESGQSIRLTQQHHIGYKTTGKGAQLIRLPKSHRGKHQLQGQAHRILAARPQVITYSGLSQSPSNYSILYAHASSTPISSTSGIPEQALWPAEITTLRGPTYSPTIAIYGLSTSRNTLKW